MKIFDQATGSLIVEDNQAQVIYESGDILYVCKAPMDSLLDSAVWQIKKIDCTSGVKIEWAHGNDNYDNKATDLATVADLQYA